MRLARKRELKRAEKEQERARAEQSAYRPAQRAERLRTLGIDPDTV